MYRRLEGKLSDRDLWVRLRKGHYGVETEFWRGNIRVIGNVRVIEIHRVLGERLRYIETRVVDSEI